MSTGEVFLIFGLVFFLFSLISKRIQGSLITAPMMFTLAGLAVATGTVYIETAHTGADHGGADHVGAMYGLNFSEGSIHALAELTLILVLAADASRISLPELRRNMVVPARLLGLGLPLIIITGAVIGKLVFPHYNWLAAALMAAILAPTDAALGASVLADERVPSKIRQGLNVESGLNDGIALPAILFLACFFNLTHQTGEQNWLLFLSLQLSLGPLVGLMVGALGGFLIAKAAKKDWITQHFQGVAAIALAVLAYAAAEQVGGNGFIAAFIAGLTYGNLHVKYSNFLYEFTETESQLLTQITFFLFGAILLPHALTGISIPVVIYAILSLTVVRMGPVALSLLGSELGWREVAFIGWFGPRGLASLLFALLILEDLNMALADDIQAIVGVTVFLSIVLHGVTATPLSARLGRGAKS